MAVKCLLLSIAFRIYLDHLMNACYCPMPSQQALSVLHSHLVQDPVIDAELHGTILLLLKEYRGTIRSF